MQFCVEMTLIKYFLSENKSIYRRKMGKTLFPHDLLCFFGYKFGLPGSSLLPPRP